MLNINRYRLRASSCPDIYRNSMTTIAKEKTQWGQGLDEFKSVLMDMLDFSFFIDIRFTLFALSNFMLYAWYDVPYMYLADFAKELGLNKKDGSSLISYIGIINMLGEIMLGWFGDRKFITAGMIYAICMVFCGLVTGLVPLLSSYTVRSKCYEFWIWNANVYGHFFFYLFRDCRYCPVCLDCLLRQTMRSPVLF